MSVQVVKDKQIKSMIVSATLESVKKVIKEFQKNDGERRTTGNDRKETNTKGEKKDGETLGRSQGGARNFVPQRR